MQTSHRLVLCLFITMWLTVVGIVSVAAFGWPQPLRLPTGDLATWMSAIGTFAAVAVALSVSARQHRQAEYHQRSLVLSQRMTAQALLGSAGNHLKQIAEASKQPRGVDEGQVEFLRGVESQLQNYDLAQLSSFELTFAFNNAMLVLSYARQHLQRALNSEVLRPGMPRVLQDWHKDYEEQLSDFGKSMLNDLLPVSRLRARLNVIQFEWRAEDKARRRAARKLASGFSPHP